MKIKLTDIDAKVVSEAPADNKQYARKNGSWTEVVANTGGGTAEYPDLQGNAGKVLTVNSTADNVQWTDPVTGAKGDKGDRGDTGTAGRGVQSVTINPSSQLIVNYTDNTSTNAGNITDYGVPPGGANGQYLVKISNADRATAWVDSPFGGMDSPYRFGGFFTTTPVADEVVMMHVAVDPFKLGDNLVGAKARVGTPPASEVTLLVQNNGTTLGSIIIQPNGNVDFYTLNDVTNIAVNDLITVVAPANSQGLARMAFTFRSI